MQEKVTPLPSRSAGKKAKKKTAARSTTPWLNPKRVQDALPFLQLGLGLLEGNKAARPYVRTLRSVLNLGDVALGSTESAPELLQKVRNTRIEIKELKKQKPLDKEKLKSLRAELDSYLDLALKIP